MRENKEMEERVLEVPKLEQKNRKLAKLLKEIQGQLTEIVTPPPFSTYLL